MKTEIARVSSFAKPPFCWPRRVATPPGCMQLTVTPVPSRRRPSSRVKRMLAAFDRP